MKKIIGYKWIGSKFVGTDNYLVQLLDNAGLPRQFIPYYEVVNRNIEQQIEDSPYYIKVVE